MLAVPLLIRILLGFENAMFCLVNYTFTAIGLFFIAESESQNTEQW